MLPVGTLVAVGSLLVVGYSFELVADLDLLLVDLDLLQAALDNLLVVVGKPIELIPVDHLVVLLDPHLRNKPCSQ